MTVAPVLVHPRTALGLPRLRLRGRLGGAELVLALWRCHRPAHTVGRRQANERWLRSRGGETARPARRLAAQDRVQACPAGVGRCRGRMAAWGRRQPGAGLCSFVQPRADYWHMAGRCERCKRPTLARPPPRELRVYANCVGRGSCPVPRRPAAVIVLFRMRASSKNRPADRTAEGDWVLT